MIRLRVEIDSHKLEVALRHFPDELTSNTRDALDHSGKHFLKHWRKARLMGPPGVRGSVQGFFSRFRMETSRWGLTGDLDALNSKLEIYTYSKVALLHETGGVVRPSRGRLAVPLSSRREMFTSTGRLRKRYKKPNSLKNVKAIKLKSGTFLAKIFKRKKTVKPLFALKKKVRLSPRLHFYKTWDDQENWRMERFNKAIDKTLRST